MPKTTFRDMGAGLLLIAALLIASVIIGCTTYETHKTVTIEQGGITITARDVYDESGELAGIWPEGISVYVSASEETEDSLKQRGEIRAAASVNSANASPSVGSLLPAEEEPE